ADQSKAAAVKPEQNVVLGKSRHGETPLGSRGNTCRGARNRGGAHGCDALEGTHSRCMIAWSWNCRAGERGLLVVPILTANAGADQTRSEERIELYGIPKIPILVDRRANPGCGRRRRRLEIVWISHIGS